jgi:uncharacterized membrane protein
MSNKITQNIIVKGNVSELYNLWANFENFPHFMEHIDSVTKLDDRTSHWVMNGPLGISVAWDVETTRLEEGKRIAWSSKDNVGDIKTSGQVTFNPLSHDQVEITVTLHYVPAGGAVGNLAANLMSNPEKQLAEDLRNFKAYAEEKEGAMRQV